MINLNFYIKYTVSYVLKQSYLYFSSILINLGKVLKNLLKIRLR